MASSLLNIPTLTTAAELERKQSQRSVDWTVAAFAGCVVELRAAGPSATLTLVSRLIVDAQRNAEPVAWISATNSLFFPPDLHDNGIDLDALPVIRMRDPKSAGIACDKLLRCGAFGLLIVDLGADPFLGDALQNRLARHAEEAQAAVVCLTEFRAGVRTMGTLVSARFEATRSTGPGARVRCIATAAKDRSRGPRWSYEEECHAALGMR